MYFWDNNSQAIAEHGRAMVKRFLKDKSKKDKIFRRFASQDNEIAFSLLYRLERSGMEISPLLVF